MSTKRSMTCWVIPNGKGEPWPIDEDDTKPVYLKDGLPHYADGELFNYHLGDLRNKQKETDDQIEGQMSIFDFLGDVQ